MKPSVSLPPAAKPRMGPPPTVTNSPGLPGFRASPPPRVLEHEPGAALVDPAGRVGFFAEIGAGVAREVLWLPFGHHRLRFRLLFLRNRRTELVRKEDRRDRGRKFPRVCVCAIAEHDHREMLGRHARDIRAISDPGTTV